MKVTCGQSVWAERVGSSAGREAITNMENTHGSHTRQGVLVDLKASIARRRVPHQVNEASPWEAGDTAAARQIQWLRGNTLWRR